MGASDGMPPTDADLLRMVDRLEGLLADEPAFDRRPDPARADEVRRELRGLLANGIDLARQLHAVR